jgi:hypothetical protein
MPARDRAAVRAGYIHMTALSHAPGDSPHDNLGRIVGSFIRAEAQKTVSKVIGRDAVGI